MPSLCVEVFDALHSAIVNRVPMVPRSSSDKEYFAQDWFAEQVSRINGIRIAAQGRNSYPDFWIELGAERNGYEIKSLAYANDRPARKDIDFNSTIPSGHRGGHPVFLVFFLYTGRGKDDRSVHSLVVAHGDLINADSELAAQHENVAIRGFGSYGDGFIRDRKMYVLPHPVTIYPAALGKEVLIVPSPWGIADKKVTKIDMIQRTIVEKRLVKYTVSLWKELPTHVTEDSPRARETIIFDVFTPA